MLTIAFAGTPPFAARALLSLLEEGYRPGLVLTQPDRPAGRGMQSQASAVKKLALDFQCDVYQPVSLRHGADASETVELLRTVCDGGPPDVLVVAAYGLILPPSVLSIPRLGCLNIHASLLPRWRGASPVHRAIEAGDSETGITIMYMDEGLDTGDIGLMQTLPIFPDDNTGTLTERLANLGADLIIDALKRLALGVLPRFPQPSEDVTYANKLTKNETWIDWAKSAVVIERQLRAWNPQSGGRTGFLSANGPEIIKIWSGFPVQGYSSGNPLTPGVVLAVERDAWLVSCGEGVLRVCEAQRSGGKRQAAGLVAQACKLQVGERLVSSSFVIDREGSNV